MFRSFGRGLTVQLARRTGGLAGSSAIHERVREARGEESPDFFHLELRAISLIAMLSN